MKTIHVIDSHTGGEPTRVVVRGAPELAGRTLMDKVSDFRTNYDTFRSSVVNEPRGNDAVVGAVLMEPTKSDCVAGVIFFNNVGYLGMCVHGTIGVVETLAYQERIQPGEHMLETPVGRVKAVLHEDKSVSVSQVPSFRFRAGLDIDAGDYGLVHGDVAWGGNWFFLVKESPVPVGPKNISELTALGNHIRHALKRDNVTGVGGQEVDHIELFTDQTDHPGNHSKNFVLCPGSAYDRSPCGTGTSAKLACLAADGLLAPGDTWQQESIIGSSFAGSYQWLSGGRILPTITGSAWITGESQLILHENDPFCWGIR